MLNNDIYNSEISESTEAAGQDIYYGVQHDQTLALTFLVLLGMIFGLMVWHSLSERWFA